jgi:hypothetical protein
MLLLCFATFAASEWLASTVVHPPPTSRGLDRSLDIVWRYVWSLIMQGKRFALVKTTRSHDSR